MSFQEIRSNPLEKFLDTWGISEDVEEFLSGVRDSGRYTWMAGVEARRITGKHDLIVYLLDKDRSQAYTPVEITQIARHNNAHAAISRKVSSVIDMSMEILDGSEYTPESAYRLVSSAEPGNPQPVVVFCESLAVAKRR